MTEHVWLVVHWYLGNPASERRSLMELVVSREDIPAVYGQLLKNRGAARVNGMEVEQLQPYIEPHWEALRESQL